MLYKTNDLTLKEILSGFYQHKKVMIITTIVGLCIGIILGFIQMVYYSYNNQYYAQVSIAVNAKTATGEYAAGKDDTPDAADITLSESIAPSSEFLARSERIYNTVKNKLKLSIGYEEFKQAIHIEQYEDTQILQLKVTLDNADEAVLIANEITKVLPKTLQETMEVGSINVIDNSLDANPVHHGFDLLFVVAGLLIGFLSSLVWSIIYTASYPKIHASEDLEKLLSLDAFAEIPHQSSSEKQEYLKISSRDISLPFIENYGTLTAIIQAEMKKRKAKTLLVTSSLESEGKSTVVVNLGQALAAMGRKVLVIDCDIRKPTIGKAFAVTKENRRCLNNVVEGAMSVNDAVININKNLAILQCQRSHKMILNDTCTFFIKSLKETYDYILLDTPPIGIIADAFQLSECADAALFVVKQSFTTEKMALYAKNQLLKSGVPILGAVMNDVRESKRQKLYYKKYYRRSYLNSPSPLRVDKNKNESMKG